MTEARTLRGLVRELLAYPLPRGLGLGHALGGLLIASFAIQVVTGALLALYYSPSASDAWESVRYVEEEVVAGSLIRGVHHFGSSTFVVLLVLHVARTFLWAAYKGPRKATWVAGSLLLACVLAFGFTGYLLPWDLKAFFGTRVGVGIAGSAPIVGPKLAELLAGGPAVGALTLPRFYAAHAVILPMVTAALIVVHLVLLRMHGVTPHWRHGYAASGRLFHPHQTAKDSVAALCLIALLLLLAARYGAPLEAKADPQSTTYVPRPEWYFLGAQQLLRLFQGRLEVLGSFVIPALGAALFVTLPWWDRNPSTDPARRRGMLALGGAALLGVVALTIWGDVELGREQRAMDLRVARQEERAEAPAEPADAPADAPADPAELAERGARLYADLACAACHAPEAGVAGAPPLDFEGSRVQRAWLGPYLDDPDPIRYDWTGEPLPVRMPDFELREDERDALVAHLAGLTDPRFDDAAVAAPESPEVVARGRALVDELACMDCHVLAGDGDPVGPDLDGVGARLLPGYARALLLDPEGVIPGTSMTDFGLSGEEADAITRYLGTLR